VEHGWCPATGRLLMSLFALSLAKHIVHSVTFMGGPIKISSSGAMFYTIVDTYNGECKQIDQGINSLTRHTSVPLPPLQNYTLRSRGQGAGIWLPWIGSL
jgi:hypothetical protein